jgi:hypothetical protein
MNSGSAGPAHSPTDAVPNFVATKQFYTRVCHGDTHRHVQSDHEAQINKTSFTSFTHGGKCDGVSSVTLNCVV